MGGYALTGSLGNHFLMGTILYLCCKPARRIQLIDRLFNCCALGQATEILMHMPWNKPRGEESGLATKAAMKARNTPVASLLRHLRRDTVRLTAMPCPAGVAQQVL